VSLFILYPIHKLISLTPTQTPYFMRTVESPSDGEASDSPDSPELVTAAVSSIKSRPSAIPVDSPMLAQLSPKRLLKAKKVRALEEASYSVSQKAVEVLSKGVVGEMWMLNRVAVLAIFVCIALMVACGPGPTVRSPGSVTVAIASAPAPASAATTASLPAFFEEHDVFSSAAISAHHEGVERLLLRTQEAVEKGRDMVISSGRLYGEAYGARFALAGSFRNAHQRVVKMVREAVALAVGFVEHQLSSFFSKGGPAFLRHATKMASAFATAFDSAPIPGLMDTL